MKFFKLFIIIKTKSFNSNDYIQLNVITFLLLSGFTAPLHRKKFK